MPGPPQANLLRPAAAAFAVGVSALAAGSRPWLALPALFFVIVAVTLQEGRWRWGVGLVGGVLATVAMGRFTVEWVAPSLAIAGKQATEERAVSRLREILWAEERVREGKWVDSDGDGVFEYALLGELTMADTRRAGVKLEVPVMRREQLAEDDAPEPVRHVYRSEGYEFVVYLPSKANGVIDAGAAAHRWVAYAWPVLIDRGGRRAFYIDQDERICETDNRQGYSGTATIPSATAALQGATAAGLDATPCGATTTDGGNWRAWKNKKTLRRRKEP